MEKVKADKIAVPTIIALSIIVPIVVVILMYMPVRFNLFDTESGTLPFFHALLNGSTAIVLTLGYFFMTIKAYKWHRNTIYTQLIIDIKCRNPMMEFFKLHMRCGSIEAKNKRQGDDESGYRKS